MEKISSENLVINFKNWLEKDLLTEASVVQLMSSHGIPKSFAKHAKTKCSNANVGFIVEVFLKNYKTMVENMTSESAIERDKMLSDNYIMEFDRFMGYTGETLDKYLKNNKGKKHRKELLELCEQGWTKFLKKMREYKKTLKEPMNEVRLNKVWRKRIKERAKRHDREVSPDDKKWAKKRIKELNKTHPELEEVYLNEIEAAMEAAKASNVYLEKLKLLRKQKLEAKKTGMVKPENKPKASPPRPPPIEKRKHNKIPSSASMPTVAPGAGFGGIAEQEENNNE